MKISAKAIIPIAFVAALLVAIVTVAVVNLQALTATATHTITETDPATVKVARTNRLVLSLGMGVYKSLSYDSKSAEFKAAMEQFTKDVATIETNFADLETLLPSKKSDIAALKAQYDALAVKLKSQQEGGIKTNGFTLGSKNTPEDMDTGAALAIKQVGVDADISALGKAFTAFNDGIIAESKAEADQL